MRNFGDYTQRLPFEQAVPKIPTQDTPPFTLSLPEPLDFQTVEGRQTLESYARMYRDFWWQFNINVESPLGSQSDSKTIQNDCYFSAQYMILEGTYVDSVLLDFSLELRDNGRNLSFSDQAMRSALIMGTPERPFYFPNQIIFRPNSTFTITIWDRSGQEDNVVHVLVGGRLYHI